jgi:DNA replication licensing factor MCM2
MHLQESNAPLAYWVSNAPAEVLKIFDVVAYEVTLDAFQYFDENKSEIHVRLTEVPDCKTLRDLR